MPVPGDTSSLAAKEPMKGPRELLNRWTCRHNGEWHRERPGSQLGLLLAGQPVVAVVVLTVVALL